MTDHYEVRTPNGPVFARFAPADAGLLAKEFGSKIRDGTLQLTRNGHPVQLQVPMTDAQLS